MDYSPQQKLENLRSALNERMKERKSIVEEEEMEGLRVPVRILAIGSVRYVLLVPICYPE